MKFAINNLVTQVYRRIFHEEISADVHVFLNNILYIGVGTITSTLFVTIFTILGGRILGPEEYGKFALIQSVAMFLYIPMILGFNTAMLKYTSEKPDYQRQTNIIISTYIFVLLLTCASIIVYLVFTPSFSRLFGISTELFYLTVILAALFVFYTLTTSALRGLNRMRLYSIFQIVYGTIILLSFIAFIINRPISYKTMIFPMLLAYGIIIILIFALFLRKPAKYKIDISLTRMLATYAVIDVIGGLSYTFYSNFDKIMINNFLSVADLGIYSAYYAASIGIAGILGGIFNLVFFPTISGYENKSPIFHKINKLLPYLIVLGIPFILICEFIVLKLYGDQYSPNILWMMLFAIASISIVIEGLYNWLLCSIGLRGVRISSFSALLIAAINVGLNYISIPILGISGAVISLIIAYLLSILIKLLIGRNYLRNGIDIGKLSTRLNSGS